MRLPKSITHGGWRKLSPLVSVVLAFLATSCGTLGGAVSFNGARDLADVGRRLAIAAGNLPYLTVRSLGTVQYGAFSSPVWAVSYRPAAPSRYRILVTGGMHGNEPAGTEVVLALIERIARVPADYADFEIDLVPLVNPWGWVHDMRHNGAGLDVNRTFLRGQSQESALLKAWLAGRKYDLAIDHHEDGHHNAFYALTYDNADLSACEKVTSVMRQHGFDIRAFAQSQGFIHVSRAEMPFERRTTISLYARLYHTERAYIIETPYYASTAQRVEMHRLAQEILLGSLRTVSETLLSDRAETAMGDRRTSPDSGGSRLTHAPAN